MTSLVDVIERELNHIMDLGKPLGNRGKAAIIAGGVEHEIKQRAGELLFNILFPRPEDD